MISLDRDKLKRKVNISDYSLVSTGVETMTLTHIKYKAIQCNSLKL